MPSHKAAYAKEWVDRDLHHWKRDYIPLSFRFMGVASSQSWTFVRWREAQRISDAIRITNDIAECLRLSSR